MVVLNNHRRKPYIFSGVFKCNINFLDKSSQGSIIYSNPIILRRESLDHNIDFLQVSLDSNDILNNKWSYKEIFMS